MRKANEAGLVTVTPSGGQRSPNIYALRDADDAPPSAQAQADWHRRRWQTANAARDELQAAFDSGRVTPIPPEQIARYRELRELAVSLPDPPPWTGPTSIPICGHALRSPIGTPAYCVRKPGHPGSHRATIKGRGAREVQRRYDTPKRWNAGV